MNKWLNKKLNQKKRDGQGFTLIELLVVITVLGILAAIIAYAVQNMSAQARTAAGGTSQSEIAQAEQQYCQQNGTYGAVPDLVNAGLLQNPSPNTTIYVSTIPQNAQIYASCAASSAGASSISTTGTATAAATSGTVYDVYPQTITQPDGSQAIIPAPPTNVVTVDIPGAPEEDLAVLGVTPYGGTNEAESGVYLPEYGPNSITSLINQTNYQVLGGIGGPNFQLVAAANPQLIVGHLGFETGAGSTAQLEAIAPVISNESSSEPGARQNQTGSTQPTLPVGASLATPAPGDPSILSWFNQVVQLGTILNRQAQA